MRKSFILKIDKSNLDLSKLNHSRMKYSISPRRKRKSNGKNSLKTNSCFSPKNKKVVGKQISLNSFTKRRYSCVNPLGISNINYNGENSKRHSLEIVQSQTKKFYQRYNLKARGDNILNENFNCPSPLNIIEHNIKKALNNLLVKIEKKQDNLSQKEESISPDKKANKLASSPNLKFVFIKKKAKNTKHNLHSSVLLKEINVSDFSFHQKNNGKKRSKSFDYNGHLKKKIIKKMRNKLFENTNKKSIVLQPLEPIVDEDDESDVNKNNTGLSFDPNSNFILIFDILLIISNLYSFIFFPLNTARNIELTKHNSIVNEIIYYSIDFIFLSDFIITIFRGYYNFEVQIIRNNKKIIIHYFKTFFFIDLIQSLPLYTLLRIFKNSNRKIYLNNTDPESLVYVLVLFIKPFKIFKIIRKKQNKALEDFYSFLSERSYYLEELVKFLMYFLIFFLFIHLFICLHIYFAFQNYPNWIIKMDIINGTFVDKYVASLYFMITTMTTVGYGDIVCVSFIERIYHIILLFIGTLLYTFLVSILNSKIIPKKNI